MQICQQCGREVPRIVLVGAVRLNLEGRKRCLDCRPHRPLQHPRRSVVRPVALKACEACGRMFPRRLVINGELRYLYRRRFCLTCSPFGLRNTSKTPPGIAEPEELREFRRRRKNGQSYASQKKRRQARKALLIEMRGGRCEDCGYSDVLGALEFHHRDPVTKEFGVGNWSGSLERLMAEVEKCDLVCSNCHRLRHASIDEARPGDPVVEHRRRRKLRAIQHMGGRCEGCHRTMAPAVFEFHHLKAAEKAFGISETGVPHRWEKTVAELSKCVMLCANCHREVHAGYRELDVLHGLAEESTEYVA